MKHVSQSLKKCYTDLLFVKLYIALWVFITHFQFTITLKTSEPRNYTMNLLCILLDKAIFEKNILSLVLRKIVNALHASALHVKVRVNEFTLIIS